MSGRSSPWFQALPGPECGARATTLFCLPHAGAGPMAFRDWRDRFAPGRIDIVPVQYPGRAARTAEAPETSLRRMAQRLAGPVAERAGDGPWALFGHSMGALIAYELAVVLTRLGRPPAQLLVSGQTAPHLHRPDRVHRLPDAELTEHITRLQGTPADVLANASLLELLLPVLRKDFAACANYTYQETAPLTTGITALGGADDPGVDPNLLRRWADLTTGRTEVEIFPGGHFFLFEHASAVVSTVSAALRLPEV